MVRIGIVDAVSRYRSLVCDELEVAWSTWLWVSGDMPLLRPMATITWTMWLAGSVLPSISMVRGSLLRKGRRSRRAEASRTTIPHYRSSIHWITRDWRAFRRPAALPHARVFACQPYAYNLPFASKRVHCSRLMYPRRAGRELELRTLGVFVGTLTNQGPKSAPLAAFILSPASS